VHLSVCVRTCCEFVRASLLLSCDSYTCIDMYAGTMLEPGSDFSKLLKFMYASKDACKNGNTARVVSACV
jgi:hypothetical protein